ncbi:MAG: hypothetical protein AVDCRST_MAG56-3067, partial [uncultured Cytophagales bacterium]
DDNYLAVLHPEPFRGNAQVQAYFGVVAGGRRPAVQRVHRVQRLLLQRARDHQARPGPLALPDEQRPPGLGAVVFPADHHPPVGPVPGHRAPGQHLEARVQPGRAAVERVRGQADPVYGADRLHHGHAVCLDRRRGRPAGRAAAGTGFCPLHRPCRPGPGVQPALPGGAGHCGHPVLRGVPFPQLRPARRLRPADDRSRRHADAVGTHLQVSVRVAHADLAPPPRKPRLFYHGDRPEPAGLRHRSPFRLLRDGPAGRGI